MLDSQLALLREFRRSTFFTAFQALIDEKVAEAQNEMETATDQMEMWRSQGKVRVLRDVMKHLEDLDLLCGLIGQHRDNPSVDPGDDKES